jgi:hypothetical protein
MTDNDLTHIYFLLDRSGSMESIREQTVAGFDAFIAEQRNAPGRCRVTLAQFDNEYQEVYTDLPIAEIGGLVLEPRGSTALLDSIGRLITTAGGRLTSLPEDQRPGTVIVGIMTDGHENASHEYRYADVKALIERQTDEFSWQFLYMGADQDAIEVGTRLGVDADHSLTYARDNVGPAMMAMSDSVRTYREARSAGVAPQEARRRSRYTEDQRRRSDS